MSSKGEVVGSGFQRVRQRHDRTAALGSEILCIYLRHRDLILRHLTRFSPLERIHTTRSKHWHCREAAYDATHLSAVAVTAGDTPGCRKSVGPFAMTSYFAVFHRAIIMPLASLDGIAATFHRRLEPDERRTTRASPWARTASTRRRSDRKQRS